ncbi:MAG: hypothetical protein WCK02_16145 [Bacteroidota bacterium]
MSRGVLTVARIERILFHEFEADNATPQELTPNEKEKILQYRAAFTYWLEKPELSDNKIIEFLNVHYSLNRIQANHIVFALKSILGNVRNASKEWQRYTLIEMAKKIWVIAEVQQDVKGMAMAANLLGKYTKLDKNEQDEIPYDQIIPPSFEPSADISVLDERLKIPNLEEKRAKLRNKYKADLSHIEDAEIIAE